MRTRERMENALPKLTRFKTEILEPRRAIPYIETVEPIRPKPRKDTELPSELQLYTESEEPNLDWPNAEIELPRRA